MNDTNINAIEADYNKEGYYIIRPSSEIEKYGSTYVNSPQPKKGYTTIVISVTMLSGILILLLLKNKGVSFSSVISSATNTQDTALDFFSRAVSIVDNSDLINASLVNSNANSLLQASKTYTDTQIERTKAMTETSTEKGKVTSAEKTELALNALSSLLTGATAIFAGGAAGGLGASATTSGSSANMASLAKQLIATSSTTKA